MIELSSNIVNVSTLAAFLKRSERRIQQHVSEDGAPRPNDRGEYNFLMYVEWYIEHLRNQIKVLEAGGDKKYELEAKRLEITIKRESVRFQKEIKQLIPLAEVRQAYVSDAIAYRTSLENLERKLVLVLSADSEQQKLIKQEIEDVRNQLGTELRLNEKEDADDFEIEEPETQIEGLTDDTN